MTPRPRHDLADVMGDPGGGPAPPTALSSPAPRLRGFRVILASASPRRREILGLAVRMVLRGVTSEAGAGLP